MSEKNRDDKNRSVHVKKRFEIMRRSMMNLSNKLKKLSMNMIMPFYKD